MVKVVINCKLNIQTQHKFMYAHQQILFFKLLFNVTLTKAKVWERYGKVWAIYDPYVGMIWDS
jgi:hypothetical protein